MEIQCPNCGCKFEENIDTTLHTEHDSKCEETHCKECDHCEFSNGIAADTCRCNKCSCFDINYGPNLPFVKG